MDVHVPGAITQGLRQRGVDVQTAQQDAAAELEDAELLDRATTLQRPLFSQDSDLLAEAKHRQWNGVEFSGVIYAHQQALSLLRFIEELEVIGKAGEPADFTNKMTYLPLR